MNFKLPDLKYKYNELEPAIDAKTMEIHYSKHHAGYVTNLNKALENEKKLQNKSIDELLTKLDDVPEESRTAVRNNGGGHYNHTLFWNVMTPKPSSNKPTEVLATEIDNTFGSFENFKEDFTKAATTRFGSGWAWLSLDSSNKLFVSSSPNQDNPLMDGAKPILGLDVWEHAYYLKYQNLRADYIKNWWSVVNWDQIYKNYEQASK